jgi:hypothetical protein
MGKVDGEQDISSPDLYRRRCRLIFSLQSSADGLDARNSGFVLFLRLSSVGGTHQTTRLLRVKGELTHTTKNIV